MPKAYVLDMFPYPSGAGLHVGHPEGYTATDIVSRYLRMKGYNVLHPMGWDAFGLPAEQYAIKQNVHPRITTEQNIANFRRQIQMLGLSYDWDREIDTTDPDLLPLDAVDFPAAVQQLFRSGRPEGEADRASDQRIAEREFRGCGRMGRFMSIRRDPRRWSRFGGKCGSSGCGASWTKENSAKSSTTSGWRTWMRFRSTGARGWGRCWPMKK